MNRASRFLRALGSIVFLGAGLFYVFASPRTTASYFDSTYPAVVWGWVFILGGIVSLIGVISQYVHIERFGILSIVIAGVCLCAGQTLVMFDSPIVWTRGGGTLAYFGFTLFAFERWYRLGADEQAINAVADKKG